MIITDAKPLRKGRVQLYIDGEEAARISVQIWQNSRFSVESEITDEELFDLIESSERFLAREKALWLLSFRDYTKRGLLEKLSGEFRRESAQEVCDALEEAGIISDERFADYQARFLITQKGYSKNRAVWELVKKGIPRDLAGEAAEKVENDPYETAVRLILKKYPDAAQNDASFRRAAAFLKRYGYSPQVIREAFRKINDM